MKPLLVMIVHAMLLSTMFFPDQAAAKELPLLPEKQGTFEFPSRIDYTDPQCGFSGAEIQENLMEIAETLDIITVESLLRHIRR